MRSVFLIYFVLIFQVNNVCAQTITQTETSVTDNIKPIRVIFSSYTSPYVFEDGSGIVIDIVTEALRPAGYKVVPVFLPQGRGFKMFADRKIEATSIIKKSSGLKNAFYSDYFMQYHNYAITLKSGPRVDSINDLANLDVIAFQNAHLYLGRNYGQIVSSNPNYKELHNQEIQVLMLLSGRTDVAVMDISIFQFYKNKLSSEGKVYAEVSVVFNNLFEPTRYRTAFIDYHIRDAFNQGLQILRESGRYDEIYDNYIDKYFDIPR